MSSVPPEDGPPGIVQKAVATLATASGPTSFSVGTPPRSGARSGPPGDGAEDFSPVRRRVLPDEPITPPPGCALEELRVFVVARLNGVESKLKALDGHAAVANDRLDKLWQIEPSQGELAGRVTQVETRTLTLENIVAKHGLQDLDPILGVVDLKVHEAEAALHMLRGELSTFGKAVD